MGKVFLGVILAVCLGVFAGALENARADGSQGMLYLHNRAFDPLAGDTLPLPSATDEARMAKVASTTGYYIVQFSGPVRAAWKQGVVGLGAELFDYIPQNAFVARLDSDAVDAVSALPYVRWVGEYAPEYRVSSMVHDVSSARLKEQGGQVELRVVAFPGVDATALAEAVTAMGGTVLASSTSDWGARLKVRIAPTAVAGLQDIDGIKWIEQARERHLNNGVARQIMQVTGAQQALNQGADALGLYGEGQIVAIADTGLDTGDTATMHADFGDGVGGSRVVGYDVPEGVSSADLDGHGTHVAGSVAGNGARSGADPANDDFPASSNAGSAPKAQIFFQATANVEGSLVGLPDDLADLFQPAWDAGARVHSNSWGSAGTGFYESEGMALDQFVWDHKDFLPVFAAGNQGQDKDQDGVIDTYSLDTPATAKNCLTVGASESVRASGGYAEDFWDTFASRHYVAPINEDLTSDEPYGMAAFSSRGPTLDGRHKPDIVAPGVNILSTLSSVATGYNWGDYDDYYCWMGGTSMATPLTSGVAALMREYLIKREGIAVPSAALVKAALIHGATPLNPGQYGEGNTQELSAVPDAAQGWGRVNLLGSVNAGSARPTEFHDITADAPEDAGYTRTFAFDVKDDGLPFRATLAWSDYPGTPLAEGGLVNDLDLRVRKPDGTWAYPRKAAGYSTLTSDTYVTSVDVFDPSGVLGLVLTPETYPVQFETLAMYYANSEYLVEDVSVVVYAWDGTAPGKELFRKTYGYLAPGYVSVPVGVTLKQGSVLVRLEKEVSTAGLYAQAGNESQRGYQDTGDGWELATITPAMFGYFRSQVETSDFDRANNVVSVWVENPDPGTYTVEVSAYAVPQGPQPYALVLSGMQAKIAEVVDTDPVQPDAPTLTGLAGTLTARGAGKANSLYDISLGQVYGKETAFQADIAGDGAVALRYPVSDLPKAPASSLVLTAVLEKGHAERLAYPMVETYQDGNWWLTDAAGRFVDQGTKLDQDRTYYVVAAMADNGAYDREAESGRVGGLLLLADPETSGGGCVLGLGGMADYGTFLLLMAAGVLLALRLRRRA